MNPLVCVWLFTSLFVAPLVSVSASGAEIDVRGAPVYRPNVYVENPNGYSPAWVCANSAISPLRAHCDDLGYNPLEGWKEELQLALTAGGVRHFYGLRHGILRSECRQLKKQLQALLKGGVEYCIIGDDAGISQVDGKPQQAWVFFELRTTTGSAADFEDWHRKTP